jgi:hypothetical protein
MREAEIDLTAACFCGAEGLAFALKSVPHTGQRVAVSARRVPHVGQTCVL